MKVVNVNTINDTIFLVNKCDLDKILKIGIIETTKEDDNKEKVYIISKMQDNLTQKLYILLLKNKETKKISDSIKKIDSLVKYQKKYGKHKRYELIKIALEKYLNEKIKDIIPMEELDKKNLEDVLIKVVQTMVERSENMISEGTKIITEYIEETNEKNIDDFEIELNRNIERIKAGICNNNFLIISEIENKVYLPYRIDELKEYIINDKEKYIDLQDVIKKEFIKEYKIFFDTPSKARFFETYKLIKNKEKRNFIVAFFYAIKMMFYKDINAAIIASCKNQLQLNNYLYFLKSKNVDNFEYFKIIYDVSPQK